MESNEFRELIIKARDGDMDALGTLIDKYRPYLWTLAQDQFDSQLNARVDASDVVQLTCLEIHRDFQAFNGELEGELLAWAKRILTNNVSNTIRHHIRTKKRSTDNDRSLDDTHGRGQAMRDNVAGKQSSPSMRAMRGEQANRLSDLLDLLPEDQRKAVRMRHLESCTLREISEHLGRSEDAVAGLLKRGMKKLRSYLSEDEQA